jgi:hypothetical protein
MSSLPDLPGKSNNVDIVSILASKVIAPRWQDLSTFISKIDFTPRYILEIFRQDLCLFLRHFM